MAAANNSPAGHVGTHGRKHWQTAGFVAQAPGYSAVVSRPMSFTQMFERLAAGEYTSWAPVQADFETMFNNAMVYNAPDTIYHRKVCYL